MSEATLLHVQIANGDSPESRNHSRLFAHARSSVRVYALHHAWSGDRESARIFEAASGAEMHALDFGWRPVRPGQRPRRVAKLAAAGRFILGLQQALVLALRLRPEVIYSSQQRWDLMAATYLATMLRRPQIVHLHYTVGPWLGSLPLRRLRSCSHVIVISNFIRDQAQRHGVRSDRLTLIYNPIPDLRAAGFNARESVRSEFGVPLDATLLTIIARLDPSKGQADCIRAFASIASRHPRARLLIVGDRLTETGTDRRTLQDLATSLGVSGRIIFAGPQRFHRIPDLLAATDIFVHPSRDEPFGLAIVEAASTGLPVIAYADGATSEIVCHGETGLLALVADIQALATHMDTLIGAPEIASALGLAGQHYVRERFDPIMLGQRLADVVLDVAHSHVTRREL